MQGKWKRHLWTQEEDKQLKFLVEEKKITNWVIVSKYFDGRSNKDCRDHYLFQLSPKYVRRKWTDEEEAFLLQKYKEYGPKWVKLTSFFDKRSPDDLKNRIYLMQNRKNPIKNKKTNKISFSVNPTVTDNFFTSPKTEQSDHTAQLAVNTDKSTSNNIDENKSKVEGYHSIFAFEENDLDNIFSLCSAEFNFSV